MMNAQVPPNAAQVHPIYIPPQGLLAHFLRIAPGFGFWSVFALTVHAQIPLGSRLGFSGSVLPRGLLTFRTCLHSSILTQISIHSRGMFDLEFLDSHAEIQDIVILALGVKHSA